jgi:hypothetical protein
VVNSVTATAFSTRIFAGATSFIASVVAAGDVDDAVLEAATDAVETITPLRYTKERLSADLSAEDLAVRMRGDLILLAEQLQPQGADALVAQARRIAGLGGGPSRAQLEILARGEEYLDSARASSFSRPGHGGSRSKRVRVPCLRRSRVSELSEALPSCASSIRGSFASTDPGGRM